MTEIVKLPAVAASGTGGSVGADIVKKSMHRVKGEMLATVCTVAVLSVIAVSAFVLGEVCEPALEVLLFYFSEAVNYLVRRARQGPRVHGPVRRDLLPRAEPRR